MLEFIKEAIGFEFTPLNIIAQICGLVGLVIIVGSFQCKKNKNFFIMQGVGSFMFFINFLLIQAYAGALYNLVNLVRGLLFAKKEKPLWSLIVTEVLYSGAFAAGLVLLFNDPKFGSADYLPQIILSVIPFIALVVMSVFMWKGNGKHIRISQITYMSPAWIVHNIFNFSLGGLVCEVFNMISCIVAFIRHGKDGFEKK